MPNDSNRRSNLSSPGNRPQGNLPDDATRPNLNRPGFNRANLNRPDYNRANRNRGNTNRMDPNLGNYNRANLNRGNANRINANGGGGNSGGGNGGFVAGTLGSAGNEQIRDLLHVVFKRKQLIAVLFVAVALPGLLSSALQETKFMASAKVMISGSRTDPTVQPTDVTKLETRQLNESLVNSEVHVVTSRDLLESVVRSLALTNNGGGPLSSGGRPFGQQVFTLSRGLMVTPIKASNIIQIDYRHTDPMYAARVVNRVVDEYISYHAQVHGNKGLKQFYDEQRRSLEQDLRRAEQALLTFSGAEGIVSPRDEIAATVHMAGEIGSALREINASVAGAEERARVLRDQITQQPEVVKRSQYLEVNPSVTQLTSQLVDRQVDRVALLRKYTEKDRHVQDNAAEIEELRSQLDEEMRDRPTIVAHQLFRTNPLREDRLRVLLEIESQLSEMRARQTTLEDESGRIARQLVSLRQKSLEYDRLDQEVRNRRDTYELYVKREQEARISQAMDEQKLVNVDIVQRPALPLPAANTRSVSMTLSLIAGLVIGIAGAFAREYLSRSLRTESDVLRHLGLPLLGSIGEAPRS